MPTPARYWTAPVAAVLWATFVTSAAAFPRETWIDNPSSLQVLLAIMILSGTVSLGRLLYEWPPGLTVQKFLGTIMVSVASALFIGFLGLEFMRSRPLMLFAAAIGFGWLGWSGMNALASAFLQRVLQVIVGAGKGNGRNGRADP